jgi:acetylornithine deacetylase/succinyl-diaminopimelate desuccinylase-like protein
MNVSYAAKLDAIWELHVDKPAAALIEYLDPNVKLQAGAFGIVIVEFAFAKKDSRVGLRFTNPGRRQAEILWGDRSPVRRGCPLSPMQKGEKRERECVSKRGEQRFDPTSTDHSGQLSRAGSIVRRTAVTSNPLNLALTKLSRICSHDGSLQVYRAPPLADASNSACPAGTGDTWLVFFPGPGLMRGPLMRKVSLVICMLAVVSSGAGHPTPQSSTTQVRAYRSANEAGIVSELADLLSIPNVASDAVNIRRNAVKLISMMSQRGIQARLLEGAGPPSVFGELPSPGATLTVGFYAHYDGQPVDPSKWSSDPFRPILRSGPLDSGGKEIAFPGPGQRFDPESRIYARSASDDKAPIVAMLAALDALKASGVRRSVNLKFFFEGEEEAGSRHLEDVVRRNAAALQADVWICADGPVHQNRRQAIFFGVRGIVSADITVYGANRGLHSGHYGNWAPNPALGLARLLASMKDARGRILIEGFYDDVLPLGEEEKKALMEMPTLDGDLMREYGLATTDQSGRSLAELINEPSLNIDGLRSEYVGAEARTIIPSEATATVDMRLVKGNDPRRQVERLIAHIKKQGYAVVREEPDREMRLRNSLIARVTAREGYRAVRTPMSMPVAQLVIRAVEHAIGQKPVLIPTLGGSVPLWIFEEATKAPQVGVPIVNHDNNQHGANENLRLQNLWDGIEVFAAIMSMK